MSIIVTNIPITNGGNFVYSPEMVIGSSNNKDLQFIVNGVNVLKLTQTETIANVPIDFFTDLSGLAIMKFKDEAPPVDAINPVGFMKVEIEGLSNDLRVLVFQ